MASSARYDLFFIVGIVIAGNAEVISAFHLLLRASEGFPFKFKHCPTLRLFLAEPGARPREERG
ncbi:MAG: hypothetical protein ACYCZ0_03515, partial [Minisyncoccota bacterium]